MSPLCFLLMTHPSALLGEAPAFSPGVSTDECALTATDDTVTQGSAWPHGSPGLLHSQQCLKEACLPLTLPQSLLILRQLGANSASAFRVSLPHCLTHSELRTCGGKASIQQQMLCALGMLKCVLAVEGVCYPTQTWGEEEKGGLSTLFFLSSFFLPLSFSLISGSTSWPWTLCS